MDTSPADYELERLAEFCTAQRTALRRLVLCHGCFDLLHVGHVRYLEAARALGDVLVVTVTPDELVDKGPGRPVFAVRQRAELLAALRCVGAVAINRWPTAVPTIELLRPDVYAKGAEYRAAAGDPASPVGEERAAVEAAGGRFALIDGEKFSSTQILKQLTAG
ncbi:MAG: adenylyltransferase/cytidyltransferase family protein [Planctomycetota bacterium]